MRKLWLLTVVIVGSTRFLLLNYDDIKQEGKYLVFRHNVIAFSQLVDCGTHLVFYRGCSRMVSPRKGPQQTRLVCHRS